MNKTKIEWCDSSWNPVTGCLNDCAYCYARKMATRFGGSQKYANVFEENEPVRNQAGKILPYPHSFSPTFHRYKLDELQKWTKPRNVFVCSMADLFGEWVPDEWIEQVFVACEKAPQHRYLFLTKNPQRYAKLFLANKLPLYENMYFGTSVTNEETLETALEHIGELPGKTKTFLSTEPILEDISQNDFWNALIGYMCIKWVIIGAETGNCKDKIVPQKAWIDYIVSESDYNDIPIFMKDSLIPIVGEENMRREFPW